MGTLSSKNMAFRVQQIWLMAQLVTGCIILVMLLNMNLLLCLRSRDWHLSHKALRNKNMCLVHILRGTLSIFSIQTWHPPFSLSSWLGFVLALGFDMPPPPQHHHPHHPGNLVLSYSFNSMWYIHTVSLFRLQNKHVPLYYVIYIMLILSYLIILRF